LNAYANGVGSDYVNPSFFLVFKALIEEFARQDFSQVVTLFGFRTKTSRK